MTARAPTRSPDLSAVARRIVWFRPPAATLADDVFFLNFLMVYGTPEDLTVAKRRYDDDDYRRALRDALPGIFGGLLARSAGNGARSATPGEGVHPLNDRA